MINLIKADFYKLFRTKSFYINAILVVLMTLSGVFLIHFSMQNIPSSYYEYLGISGSKVMTLTVRFMNSLGLLSLFCTIFLSTFISNEFSFGTIKNILSSGQNRVSVYFSKLLISLFTVFVYVTLCSVISFLLGNILWDTGNISRNDYLNIFRMIGLNIVVEFAIQCILVMVCFLIRRNGMAMATNLIILMCTNGVIIPFLNGLIEKFFKLKDINLEKYWPQNYLSIFSSLDIPSKDLTTGLVVCGVSILVSSLIGIIVFTSRDID